MNKKQKLIINEIVFLILDFLIVYLLFILYF